MRVYYKKEIHKTWKYTKNLQWFTKLWAFSSKKNLIEHSRYISSELFSTPWRQRMRGTEQSATQCTSPIHPWRMVTLLCFYNGTLCCIRYKVGKIDLNVIFLTSLDILGTYTFLFFRENWWKRASFYSLHHCCNWNLFIDTRSQYDGGAGTYRHIHAYTSSSEK